MTPPLAMDLGQSFDSFRHGAEEFFHRLSDIGWPSMVIALLFYLAHLLARSRAWQNTLRAAYPDRSVPFSRITAAYLATAQESFAVKVERLADVWTGLRIDDVFRVELRDLAELART